jgi:digeranylgeranylglycerophospholipid reductase
MVTVEPERCAYCGGCVSICPVEALTLAETRLLVSEACIECGDCVEACPMGALRLHSPAAAPQVWGPRSAGYDLIVVGAGPGGSVAAAPAARAGLKVLLLEKRQEIGSPVRCAEGVGHDALAAFIEPDPRWIAATVDKAEIEVVVVADDPAGDAGIAPRVHRVAGGRGYILERRVFDRALAEQAAGAGAQVLVKTPVTGLLREDGRVCGVTMRGSAGELEIAARVVIAADGVEAQVGRWAGLDLALPLCDTMACAQYLLAGIDVDPTCTSYTIGYDVAPGGYAWVFPKGPGLANVGLGVQADLWRRAGSQLRPAAATVLDYLRRFIDARPALAFGHPVTLVVGNVPVATAPHRLATSGLMVIGDAARQVDPLTGGGIINAMTAGRLAAETAAAAIAAGDTSATGLARYAGAWHATVGRKMQRNYRLRRSFPPDRRTEERFVQAFMLATA